jgi:hypothetical protein
MNNNPSLVSWSTCIDSHFTNYSKHLIFAGGTIPVCRPPDPDPHPVMDSDPDLLCFKRKQS